GRHILTVAHPLVGPVARTPLTLVQFDLTRNDRNVNIPISVPAGDQFQTLHPSFSQPRAGSDIAILRLTDQERGFEQPNRQLVAPFGAQRYQLYDGLDEVGQTFTIVGYGVAGTGATGVSPDPASAGTKRWGKNRWDADARVLRN